MPDEPFYAYSELADANADHVRDGIERNPTECHRQCAWQLPLFATSRYGAACRQRDPIGYVHAH